MQGTIETAIHTVTREHVTVLASGRTDAGAHALHQVVTFATSSDMPIEKLGYGLNAVLPRTIAVIDIREEQEDFHPRFLAERRVYRYLVWNRRQRSPFWEERAMHVPFPLDESCMQSAANHLVGHHDLSAFVPTAWDGSRERSIFRADVRRDGDMLTIELEATGFLPQMVRAISGTLVWVGGGRMTPEEFRDVIESRDRTRAFETAPAHGLYLAHVEYPETPQAPRVANPNVNTHECGPYRSERT